MIPVMTRIAWMLATTTMMLAPIGCATPSSGGCEDGECDDGTGGSGDTTAGISSGKSAGTSASEDGSTEAPTTMSATEADGTTTEPSGSTSDDGGSATTGEPPFVECPAATHRCLTDPPLNWSGPFVPREVASDAVPPDCGGAYASDEGAYSLDPSSGTHSCDCECGDATGVSCTTRLRHSSSSGCPINGSTITMTDNVCHSIPDTGDDYWVVLLEMSDGSCAAQPSSQIDPVTYDSSVRFCGATERPDRCSATEQCLPVPSTPVDDVWCIVREGEHECPADGPYTFGGPSYTAYEDTRDCSGCVCGEPTGSCGEVDAVLYTQTSCGIPDYGGTADQTCDLTTTMFAPTIRAYRRVAGPVVDVSCAATGGAEIGELTLLDPITICCTR